MCIHVCVHTYVCICVCISTETCVIKCSFMPRFKNPVPDLDAGASWMCACVSAHLIRVGIPRFGRPPGTSRGFTARGWRAWMGLLIPPSPLTAWGDQALEKGEGRTGAAEQLWTFWACQWRICHVAGPRDSRWMTQSLTLWNRNAPKQVNVGTTAP